MGRRVDFSDMRSFFCHCPISLVAFYWVFNLLFLTLKVICCFCWQVPICSLTAQVRDWELLILELQPGWHQKELVQESFRDSYWGQLHLWHLRWEATLSMMRENILELCGSITPNNFAVILCVLTNWKTTALKLKFCWYPWLSGP